MSYLGTYHGNGKCHIQYTSSGKLQMVQLVELKMKNTC